MDRDEHVSGERSERREQYLRPEKVMSTGQLAGSGMKHVSVEQCRRIVEQRVVHPSEHPGDDVVVLQVEYGRQALVHCREKRSRERDEDEGIAEQDPCPMSAAEAHFSHCRLLYPIVAGGQTWVGWTTAL